MGKFFLAPCVIVMALGTPMAQAAANEMYTATVIAVPAGDVLSLERAGESARVRLWGIDAPEAGQPFAEEAAARVKELVLGKTVKAEVITQDTAGMNVARVTYGQELDLAETLVAEGLAWWDQRRANEARALKLGNAEAIREKRGLWADDAPLAPWDYRLSHDLEDFAYAGGNAPVLPAESEAPEEEIKSVSASGTGVKLFGTNPGTNPGAAPTEAPTAADLPSLLVRHQPRVVNDASGSPMGITAGDIGQIPFARQFGFQDGDVVTNVNGVAIRGMQQVPQLISQFKNVKQFNVTVMRGGQPVTLQIQVP